jgi:hypothetical protein
VAIPPATASKESRCKGLNIVPGAPTDQSAYRSEVAGLLGNATMVREICAFHDIIAGTVYLGCDGLSALLNCTDIDYVVLRLLTLTYQGNASRVPSKRDTASRPRASTTIPMPSLIARQLSISGWMKTLKCIGPKLLTSLATVNLQLPGNPWQFG